MSNNIVEGPTLMVQVWLRVMRWVGITALRDDHLRIVLTRAQSPTEGTRDVYSFATAYVTEEFFKQRTVCQQAMNPRKIETSVNFRFLPISCV